MGKKNCCYIITGSCRYQTSEKTQKLLIVIPVWVMKCRNFVKELVILFHRTSAALWGHVASIIKKSSTGDSFSISTPTAVSNRSIRSSPWRQTYLVPSTSQDPRATNARVQLKGTRHTAKFQLAFYLQNLTKPTKPYNLHITNLTLLYLTPLPYNFIW